MDFRSFQQFHQADSVFLMDRLGHTQARYTNILTIADFLAILEEQVYRWRVPNEGVPVVSRYYYFYNGDISLGHIGIEDSLLVLHYAGSFWSKHITDEERERISSVIAALQ